MNVALRGTLGISILALAILAAVPTDTATILASPDVVAADAAGAAVVEADRSRITAHLLAVERQLRAADVSHLSPERRRARAAALDHLRDYREAGRFPHNHHGRAATPLFRDAHGTLCAMAYLIERSGGGALVDRVAATENDAYVRELAEDPELVAWLDRNGMTAEEAALVQPAYGPMPAPEGETGLARSYGVIGTALLAGDGVALYLNGASAGAQRGTARGWIGVVVGLTSSVMGLLVLDEGVDGAREGLAGANVGFGVLTASLGVHRLLAGSPAPGQRAREQPRGVELSLRPAPVHRRPGLRLTARF
ncbi:MAG: hypothetical protein KY466_13890 [Gemmatimonadetes bacterium]|nr:hypothetical protein [Gemmatimonadota bacterium]